MDTYQPIDCDYYDRLEAWATRRQIVTVCFEEEDREKKNEGMIDDLFVKDHVEYMKMSNGEVIRLDTILYVDDAVKAHYLKGSCKVPEQVVPEGERKKG